MPEPGNIDEAMRSAFEGNFIDATDILAAGEVTMTIKQVWAPNQEKDATGKTINKAILAFDKTAKRLILNATNVKVIGMHHGRKPSQWVGKRVTLTVRYLDKAFGQTNVPVVRVVPPADSPLTFGMRKRYGAVKPFAERGE